MLYDDRTISPGEKFVEAELLGCPLRVVAGKRTLELDRLEVQVRRGHEARDIPLEDAAGDTDRSCSTSCPDARG